MSEHENQTSGNLKDLLASATEEASAGFDWGAGEEETAEQEELTLLQFHHGAQRYAVAGEEVREVINRSTSTELPGSPPHIRGIMIHRRQVIGLLDLDRWFGVSRGSGDDFGQSRVILVEHQNLVAGIIADPSTQIVQWSAEVLHKSLPESLPSRVRAYIKALRHDDSGTVLMLDVVKLLEDAAIKG